ncbi:MAG: hypothetical protein ACW99A_13030 [Candidatus Kariarchaeaceae archaeon]|jgi:hypothetical protein
MAITLNFINGEFVETNKGEVLATLELIPAGNTGTAKLSFSGDAGLIARRTASRQAESVCKSGFLLQTGERIGIGMVLEVVEGDRLSDAHVREGHKYNRY